MLDHADVALAFICLEDRLFAWQGDALDRRTASYAAAPVSRSPAGARAMVPRAPAHHDRAGCYALRHAGSEWVRSNDAALALARHRAVQRGTPAGATP
ncbi:MAG: hypothetical protein IPH07_11385 [Deltaproteobacteria bacterium]|jgi:hypothetical protein|nr:hypothetical protein [Deltaproteobacteria bacterium]MBK8720388.1 hypothetical protein [Deltaproteobacteria bacterium]MBP7285471.1 hypothetical protein [Nannocystaceae bacterium]